MVVAEKLNYRDCITHLCNGVAFNAILLMASGVWKQLSFPLDYGVFDSVLLISVAIPLLYVESHLVLSVNTILYDMIFSKWQHSQLVKLYCDKRILFYMLFAATVRGQRMLQFRYYNEDFSQKGDTSKYENVDDSIVLYKVQREWIREHSEENELTTRYNALFGLFKGIKIDALIGVAVAVLCASGWGVIFGCLLIFVLAWAREYKYSRLNILNRISQCRKHPFKAVGISEPSPAEK